MTKTKEELRQAMASLHAEPQTKHDSAGMNAREMAAEYVDGLKRLNKRRVFDNERPYVVPTMAQAIVKIERVIEDLREVPISQFKRRRLTEDLMIEVVFLIGDAMRKRGLHIASIDLYGRSAMTGEPRTIDAFEMIILERAGLRARVS